MGTFERNKINIFLDLDGTLIDSKYRMYKLFMDLVPNCSLTFDEYWNKKFKGKNHEEILKEGFRYTDTDFKKFEMHWMNQIEAEEYLKYDTVINEVSDWLEITNKSANLYVVTARQNYMSAELQLKRLGIFNFFKNVFVTKQLKSKKQLILESEICLSVDDIFVGDTGHDIKTGKELGIHTAAVLTGFMNVERLSTYMPDQLLNTIVDLKLKK